MTTVKDVTLKNGKRRVTIELDPGEKLIRLRPGCHYRLAYPHDEDVMPTHVLEDIARAGFTPEQCDRLDQRSLKK